MFGVTIKILKKLLPDVTIKTYTELSFAESLEMSKAVHKKYKDSIEEAPFFINNAKIREIKRFKEKFGFWEEWSGARYVRRTNPRPVKDTDMNAICRSCAYTGIWKAL